MIHCNQGLKKYLLTWNWRNLQVVNHVFGTDTIEMSDKAGWNEKPITCFKTGKKWSYIHQNDVLSVFNAFWA